MILVDNIEEIRLSLMNISPELKRNNLEMV
jgi:hypothetical protein